MWRELVKRGNELSIFIKCGEFFSRITTVSFSGRSLLYVVSQKLLWGPYIIVSNG